MTHQDLSPNGPTAALYALRTLSEFGQDDDVPLRTKLQQVLDDDDLIDNGDTIPATDYAMRYLAYATRQIPAMFVPSMASVADLMQIDRTYTTSAICDQAINHMAREMPPSRFDQSLAAMALDSIGLTIVHDGPGLVTDTMTVDALVQQELQRRPYLDADHPLCVYRTVFAGLSRAADREVTADNVMVDIAPLHTLPDLYFRAAKMINTLWLR